MHDVYLQQFMEYKQVSVKRTFKNERNLIIYKFELCTRKWVCTRTSYYVQRKMDVHRRVGTYTVRVAHWFESSFTGNNAPFNINGIQFECTDETETNDRSFICEKVFSKRVSVLCTDKSFVFFMKSIWYVQGKDVCT
jgi:hypothetical protein